VSCDKADLRPTASGIEIYEDTQRRIEALHAPQVPRSEVIDELIDTIVRGHPPVHDGAWARATTEVCLAILASARDRRPQQMHLQTGLSGH
jgi:phthalate 4,5-cis-dihydrodiol dehydrogenase